MRGYGENYKQPCEGVKNRVDDKRAWSDVIERYHKINKTELVWDHLQHVSKEVPTRHHYGETPKLFLETQHTGGASLGCLYTNSSTLVNKHDELEKCVQL